MKHLLLKSWLVMVCLLMGVGTSWADDVTETFENQSAGTTYNGQITYEESESNAGISWYVEHGTVSTNAVISGSKSLQLRAYYQGGTASGVWNGALPYAETKTPIKGLQSFTFKAAVSNTGLKMDVYYSTDGSLWTQIGTTKTFSNITAANAGTYNIPSSNPNANYYIKISVNSSSTHADKPKSNGNYTFRIDDVAFTYVAATTAYTVSFDGNGHGTPESTELTEASAGAGITLPGCTADAGYSFKGWADASDATSANVGVVGTSYKPKDNVTLYAYYVPSYTLTITQPAAGGTLTVSDANGALASGATVEAGTDLTCEVTNIPEGKRFSRFYVRYDNDGEKYKATNPATFDNIPTEGVTAAEVTVAYQDLAQYTINYMVNGVNTNAQENVWEGTALVFPTPAAINGKQFMGWVENEIDGTTNNAPSFVNIEGLTATAHKTYYAVFADVTLGDFTTTTDVLSRETTGVENGATSYSAWSNKKATSDAVYAGKSAGGNNSIQLRNNSASNTKSYDGIITTTSGGKAKKVVVEWNSNTVEGRTLNVFGKNTTYTSVQSVFQNDNQGTNLGTIVKGTSTTLYISGDYEYIAFASDAGAMYISSISIDWENGTPDKYSNYCTTVAVPTATINIETKEGFATFVCKDAIVMPEGVEGSAATVEGGKLSLAWEYQAESIVPAETPILVRGAQGNHTANITTGGTAPAANLLVANMTGAPAAASTLAPSATKFYALSYDENHKNLGFYWRAANGVSFDVPDGKVFLALPGGMISAPAFRLFDDETAIENLKNVETENAILYNIQGQRVNANAKGIVIKNGKKYFVK